MSNPLVAQAQSQTTGVTGIGIAESATDLANGIKDGSWVEGGLGALGVGLEVLSMVIDPLGTLAQYGVSWLIEHVRPLKEALDWLAGDPPVIQSFADTWANVATEVNTIAQDLTTEANTGTAGWTGEGGDAYRANVAAQTDAIAGAATLADGISTGVLIMGQVVAMVREIVRDLVAELVGKLITWALEAVCTLGFATPLIAAQATTAISSAITRIADLIRKLVKTVGNAAPKIRRVIDKLGEIIEKLSALGRKFGRHGDGPTTPSAARSGDGISTPDVDGTPSTPDTPASPDTPGTPGTAGSLRTAVSNAGNKLRDLAVSAKEKIGRALGDPVDMVSGEVLLTQTDLDLPGVFPLRLERIHLSNHRSGRWFGLSWASTLDQRIEVDAAGVVFAAADGKLLVYPRGDDGSLAKVPMAGPRHVLAGSQRDGYTITDPETGRVLRFSVVDPRSPGTMPVTAMSDRNGNTVEFRYDEAGAPVELRHSGGYRVGVTTESGRVVALTMLGAGAGGADVPVMRYDHDEDGNLSAVVNSSGLAMRFAYDGQSRMTRWKDRRGTWYEFTYDDAGRCVRGTGADGMLNSTFAYDAAHRLTRHTNSLGHTTTFHYDERGQVVRRVDPLGGTTTSEWDDRGRLLAETDPVGATTRYVTDEAGDLIEVVQPGGGRLRAEYNSLHQPVAVTDAAGAVWRWTYDERGNPRTSTSPTGATTTYTHDGRGHLLAVTDALGHTKRFETNAAGLPVTVIDEVGATTRHTYDGFGRVVSTTDPLGGVTRFGWTVEGRPAWRTLPDGSTERMTYDGEGDTVEHVDLTGAVTRIEHTHFDLKSAETTADGARVEIRYDTELRPVAVVNQQGLEWRYSYDAAGNLVRETDFNGRVLTYRHDAAGRVVERVNAAGEVIRYTYDARGAVVEQVTGEEVTTFEHDPAGRIVRAVNSAAEVTVSYDAAGRVLAETCDGRAVSSVYDALGRRVLRTTPSGGRTVWSYDAAGRPRALETAGRAITFAHDAAGRETERRFGAAALSQTWTDSHRLHTQVLTATGGGRGPRVTQRRAFTYRADGGVTAIVDQLAGPRQYSLDVLGRVTEVRTPGGTERYSYDPAGNITFAASAGAGEDGPRAYRGTRLDRAGGLHLVHDAEGRVVLRRRRSLSGRDRTWRYEWDAESRLTAVVTPDGVRWRYSYDAFGRRVAKERLAADGKTVVERTVFSWDGTRLAEQVTSGDGSATATAWDWHPESWRPLTQVERTSAADAPQGWVDSRFHAIVTDLVGTPTELVDPGGTVAWRATTALWGGAAGGDGAATPLRFPGQYHDPETGLHYNLHRYYDPLTGRYHSPDPLHLLGGLGIHSYVRNPLTWLDPLGLHGYDDSHKTIAFTDRVNTLSGWGRHEPHFTRPSFNDMRQFHQQIGHPLVAEPNGRDLGVFGRYFAMHAERQAAYLDPDAPIRVSSTMCDDCQGFFLALAQHRGIPQHVSDPHHDFTFHTNGTMSATPRH
ncbi:MULTISPECIES: DUF6531 domain-containing protein [Amycolatopsis]|uniref:RHS repeat-associated core domain-containing protein n=1 Tax=Amycolatopsis tucumanensis TaxID=401106 RepID=A0ABP7HRL8_9PSEU|nr:RHS repeat-associated core domain-containing protein [Amycolatopsis tucumanensis]MCF6421312.1 DUF6531 domain-containing protein [Amycolatopsis tucumanensis]